MDGITYLIVTGVQRFNLFFQAEDGIRDLIVTGVQTCALFIQAEDGIRDLIVTGVQTCALPICRDAIAPLTNLLATDKEMSVRAAAAMALGRIKDETAVIALAKAIDERAPKKKAEEYEFLRRAAVESLGEIRSPAGVEVLVAVLNTEGNSLDTRRAAAMALGKIGSNSAVPALQAALHSDDPYLAEAAREALRRMHAPLK